MLIKLIKGDITEVVVEAIVNAANTSLLGGGGVDGKIHKQGGEAITNECNKIRLKQGGCKTSEAVHTTAGKLSAIFVIHTVGPIYYNGNMNEDRLLKNCYLNSLKIAEELGVKTIAFPNISTGVYRFPKDLAAKIAIDIIKEHVSTSIQEVKFVCYDDENYKIYEKLLSCTPTK
jgi:O-acetyl-ADP-ribose deacetylase (regulator of RNase III)